METKSSVHETVQLFTSSELILQYLYYYYLPSDAQITQAASSFVDTN
jgi:hypothetical protein